MKIIIKNKDKIDIKKINEVEKGLISFKRGSLIDNINNIKKTKIKSLRILVNKPQFVIIRNSVIPKFTTLGKNINIILRKTLFLFNDFNEMKGINITNYNQINNKINKK